MKNKKVLIGAIAAVIVIVLAVLLLTGVIGGKKVEDAKEAVNEAVETVEEKAEEAAETVAEEAEKVEEKVEEAAETVAEEAEKVEEKAEEAAETVAEEAEKVEEKVEEAAETVAEEAEKAEETVEEAAAEEKKAEKIVIAIPNDATNEGRALLLLQANGLIKLKADAGITATIADIEENPLGIEFTEVEAAMVVNVLQDSDYGIINGNYVLEAMKAGQELTSLLVENAESPYVNVVSVKAENKDSDMAKALAAAVLSQKAKDFFNDYDKAISTVENPTDGFDSTVDYEALKGQTIKVACTLDPHSLVLEIAKEILAEKEINLEIVVVSDYVTPNTMVDSGDVFANFFAHQPYQDDFNAQNGTDLTTIAGVHVEPMGLYAGKQTDLKALGK